MTSYSTGKIYSLSGSEADGWTVTGGNSAIAYQVIDDTEDGQISGRVTINRPGFTFPGTYVGSYGSGVVVLLDQGATYYLLTNEGPFGNGFSFQSDPSSFVICFGKGTGIATPSGSVLIETLKAGDLVLTKDNGSQPIRWIGSKKLNPWVLSRSPHLRPIRISEGALGLGCPARDLIVSPQHRILVRSAIAQKMFGANEVLVPAKHLLVVDGIEIAADLEEVEYFHILFDRHEVVVSNGAETESLFTGPEALKAVGPAARDEILSIFPELGYHAYEVCPARQMPSGRTARNMAARHYENSKFLVS